MQYFIFSFDLIEYCSGYMYNPTCMKCLYLLKTFIKSITIKSSFLVNCRCSFSKTGRNCIVPSFFASIYTPFKHPTCIVKSHYKGLHIWASYVCFLLKFGSLYTWSWNYLPFMSARRFFLVGCKFCFLHCLVLSCIICLFVLLF